MRTSLFRRSLLTLGLATALALPVQAQTIQLDGPGLKAPGSISVDPEGVPTILASNDFDAAWLLGYAHAQARFFQMDFSRRGSSGTLAELVGPAALSNDVQIRTLGLRRAAWATYVALNDELRGVLKAYADGVNAWLAANPLPPEYAGLEISRAQPWTPVDSLVIGKILAFNLSFDLDIDPTLRLAAYQAAGQAAGFNGTALFFEDTHRTAPGDDRISIPGFLTKAGVNRDASKSVVDQAPVIDPSLVRLASNYRAAIENHPLIAPTLQFREGRGASNWWIIGGQHTQSGSPILANDPHLSLNTPATFMETHITSTDARYPNPMNVVGTSAPGTPVNLMGCTDFHCWGLTTNPLDVTDAYQEQLRLNTYGLPSHTIYQGQLEPVVIVFQSYYANSIGDGVADTVGRVNDIGYLNGAATVLVPRRNFGPIVSIDTASSTGLSVQYTGWGATFELEAFRRVSRAENLSEFREALTYFDVGSQNFAYADKEGNIAYYTTAEAPIRDDLQNLLTADGGRPPFLIRDGSGTFRHEWLPVSNPQQNQAVPFEVLSLAEMPQSVNPASGYIANANNDPVGVTLDNNPLNQLRPGGGLYYLEKGYSAYRMGRIDRMIQSAIASGQPISVNQVKQMQANNQPLDAELLTPYLLTAGSNALGDGAWAPLAALGADAGVQAALVRLAQWDFSTPTGIQQGFDPFDNPTALPAPSDAEILNSTAATVFVGWRSKAIRNIVDATLSQVGLGSALPGNEESARTLKNLLDNFGAAGGVGASGLNFFNVADAPDAASARDFLLLKSLRDALDMYASDDFTAAFANSTNIDDYRWGLLHRIVFDHPLGGALNIPGPNPFPFTDVGPGLPGLARPGGYEVVDASSHSLRADGVNEFMFGSGPNRRFVGHMTPTGATYEQILPGGQSGVITDGAAYISQLPRWLTNLYKPLVIDVDTVQAIEIQRVDFQPR
ncbi:MAG: penicillin acylase family protein [Xanthomonadales bacterium]|nr:penicillin acylase family protein [Xanthomonadales bacterium]